MHPALMGHFNDAANPTIVIPPTPLTPAQIKAKAKADAVAEKAAAKVAAAQPYVPSPLIAEQTSSMLSTVLKVAGVAVAAALIFAVIAGRKK